MKTALLTLTAIALSAFSAAAGEFPDISLEDLKKKIDAEEVTVVDVNGTRAFKKGHIPTAVDYQANSEEFAKLLPKDKDALIVAYCGGPRCSAYKKAAQAAADLGYTNVKHFSAGRSGWEGAGEEFAKPEKSKKSE
ncbi:MAG: rhodanese-like domain-containing protein [Verrucomicrobiota bacterium]